MGVGTLTLTIVGGEVRDLYEGPAEPTDVHIVEGEPGLDPPHELPFANRCPHCGGRQFDRDVIARKVICTECDKSLASFA